MRRDEVGDKQDVTCGEDGHGWLEEEEHGRVFQGARGKTVASMTPGHEAQPSGYGLFN